MPLQHTQFKAAAVQAAPVYLDLDATVAKTIDLIGEGRLEVLTGLLYALNSGMAT